MHTHSIYSNKYINNEQHIFHFANVWDLNHWADSQILWNSGTLSLQNQLILHVAVPCRNRRLFHHVFRAHFCVCQLQVGQLLLFHPNIAPEVILECLKFQIFLGGGRAPMHTPLVYHLTNQKLLLTALLSLNDLKVVESIKVISFSQLSQNIKHNLAT